MLQPSVSNQGINWDSSLKKLIWLHLPVKTPATGRLPDRMFPQQDKESSSGKQPVVEMTSNQGTNSITSNTASPVNKQT